MRFDREKDHMKCVNYKKYNVCVRCKRFYVNGEDASKLEDLYVENKNYIYT